MQVADAEYVYNYSYAYADIHSAAVARRDCRALVVLGRALAKTTAVTIPAR